MMPIKGLSDNRFARRGSLPVNHVRTRLIAKVALVLLSLGGFLPASAVQARESAGFSSPAKIVKTSVKKRHTTVTRRYSSRSARARRARLARARAAARARQWREVMAPRYKVNDLGETVPDIRAEAAIIYNPVTQQVLWEENSQNPRSIASITKVMTAEVVLEDNPDLTREVAIQRSDVSRANHTYLRAGERVTIDDLLHLTLIASDNAAARALARTSPLGYDGFVRRMNEKARELGLQQTSFTDPSGLLADNVSSAFDMALLIAAASSDERVAAIMRMPYYTVLTNRRVINIHSTNQLVVKGDVDVRAGKTGFISKAGYCLATLLRLPQSGDQVAVVILGARSNAGRFMETRHLFNWLSTKAASLNLLAQPPTEAQPQD
jgi:serine-type D-Ala-D-Ala endopeptidase (penicillin-binding protein 7)